MDNIEKVMSEKGVFSNFWQADSCKDLFFNVDVCEEVTRRIKRDKNYECCLSENPNSFIGIRANISVSVERVTNVDIISEIDNMPPKDKVTKTYLKTLLSKIEIEKNRDE